MVGGKSTETETAWQGLQREIIEEVGHQPTIQKTIPLELSYICVCGRTRIYSKTKWRTFRLCLGIYQSVAITVA